MALQLAGPSITPVGPGVLVDERYGSAVIEAATSAGALLAAPVEASGRRPQNASTNGWPPPRPTHSPASPSQS
jgi:myo-inositol catabolism protein IolC